MTACQPIMAGANTLAAPRLNVCPNGAPAKAPFSFRGKRRSSGMSALRRFCKKTPEQAIWSLLRRGPSDWSRTSLTLLPNGWTKFFAFLYSRFRCFPLGIGYSLTVLYPLFPRTPALGVVKYVVRKHFSARPGRRCRQPLRSAFFCPSGGCMIPLIEPLIKWFLKNRHIRF